MRCKKCNSDNPKTSKYCGNCGHKLDEQIKPETSDRAIESERKQVTVLFSDLSGYTSMSEKLDPEEVKEIMSRIFGEIAQLITKYDGYIDKFMGDAVMAIFGIPNAHEDDPVRAIRSAIEIHEQVEKLNTPLEQRIGKHLSMHTGINTGLVVTGELDLEKGKESVLGDTINLASRLSDLASGGEIFVGEKTYHEAEGHFNFEALKPTRVKGKAEAVRAFKALSIRKRPVTVHNLSGLKADLIGRKADLTQLKEAVKGLFKGRSTIISIYGEAGIGKSRLVNEFKSSLDLEKIQWIEGHTYAYNQNSPYFLLMDLLNQIWQIEESAPPEKVKERIESGIKDLLGEREDIIPDLGHLYALEYPEMKDIDPEFWKPRLFDGVKQILSAVTQRASTVIYLEDLHWADPSSLELLRFILLEFRYPAIFLCVYRPSLTLFDSQDVRSMGDSYKEILVKDLSSSESQDMLESLLKSRNIPFELLQFIQETTEGNPFYLEEVINFQIESEMLVRDNGDWRLARSINESGIPSTIHGVISTRIDRLKKENKKIIQEASVIGRTFFYELLKRITELKNLLDKTLHSLELADLIRSKSLQPDLEYIFKHALTQEVVYNSLLKKERQILHEKTARVIEQLFSDRLSEFYENLAFHFKKGQSLDKAIEYLLKAAEKSLERYAAEESHQYYQEAYNLLENKANKTRKEEELLIHIFNKWGWVFYHRGDFRGLTEILVTHEDLVESFDDKKMLSMYYAWIGFALSFGEKINDSYQYLNKALKIGEKIDDNRVIGYASIWLAMTCMELGLFDKAIAFGERAREIAGVLKSDQYLYSQSLAGLGHCFHFTGDIKRSSEIGNMLLDYGKRHSNIRSLVMAHICLGYGNLTAGNYSLAIESFKRAIEVSADPFYSHWPRVFLGASYIYKGQFQEAEEPLKEVLTYSENFGCELIGTLASCLLGVVSFTKGQFSKGLKMIENTRKSTLENDRRVLYVFSEYVLGKCYLQIAERAGPITISVIVKNIGFLIRNIPIAAKKAEKHFNKAIEAAKKIGTKSYLGQAHLDLGLLHKKKGRHEQAKESISTAIQLFEQCEAEGYLKQARDALVFLND